MQTGFTNSEQNNVIAGDSEECLDSGNDVIIWVSDSPVLHTGQARVTREFCRRFKEDGFVPVSVGFHHSYLSLDSGCGAVCYAANKDQQIPESLIWLLDKTYPSSSVIFSHDTWLFPYLPYLRENYPETRFYGYFTIDGSPVHSSWVPIADACDAVFSPSRFGTWELQRACVSRPVNTVPYGVDLDVFNDGLRLMHNGSSYTDDMKIFNRWIPGDSFKLLYVGMHTSRKRLDRLVKAFELFQSKCEHANSYLILAVNATMNYPQGVFNIKGDFDLPGIIRESSCSDNIILGMDQFVSDDDLNILYNLADVVVLPSMGEGYGLSMLEGMACGAPVITTNYTSGYELVNGRGWLADVETYLLGGWNVKRALVDVNSLCDCMCQAYADYSSSNIWRSRQLRCASFAREFSWDSSYSRLRELMDSCSDGEFCADNVCGTV